MSFRNGRVLAWFLVAVAVLLADAAACCWSVGRLVATFRHRAESYEAVTALDRVLSALKDAAV